MTLLRRAGTPGLDGVTVSVDPATEPADLGGPGWHWISFEARTLAQGATLRRPGDAREAALIVLEGSVRLQADGRTYGEVGSRASVFEPVPAPVLLISPGTSVELEALSACHVAIAAAPAGDLRLSRLIEPETMRVESRSSGRTARTVRHLLPPDAEAGRLILVEVITPGGNWSSYPPHKHDVEDQPRESLLEELYHFRFSKPQGFALQRVYTTDRSLDEALAPGDGDVVLVPRGYHPVGAAAGYDCYYLNVMAGPTRLWHFTIDPDHTWLMDWDPGSSQQ